VSTSGEEALAFVEENPESQAGLIRFLIRQRHGSPFEHGALTFFVHAPIFVFREWHRHRVGFSYNEESGRYKTLEPVFWIPRRDRLMYRRADHKAARPRFDPLPDDFGDALYRDMLRSSEEVCGEAYRLYHTEVSAGIANEVARRLLPVSIYSSCWVTCNPRSLMHFLSLRTHEQDATFTSYPQAEIEEAARVCEDMLRAGWPLTYAAFNEFGRVAP